MSCSVHVWYACLCKSLGAFRRDSNCCVFPLMCNATQPATINLLSRNVGGPTRIPIKSSSVSKCVCVCTLCICTHTYVGQSVTVICQQSSLFQTCRPAPLPSMTNTKQSKRGHVVAKTDGLAVKLGLTRNADTNTQRPQGTVSSAAVLPA